MLPDLRFLIGATLATALLSVVALGVATTVRLSHQAKISPLETSHSLAYADRGDWNRHPDAELTRTFEALARTAVGDDDATPATAAEPSSIAPSASPAGAASLRQPAEARVLPEVTTAPTQAAVSIPSVDTMKAAQTATADAQAEPDVAVSQDIVPSASLSEPASNQPLAEAVTQPTINIPAAAAPAPSSSAAITAVSPPPEAAAAATREAMVPPAVQAETPQAIDAAVADAPAPGPTVTVSNEDEIDQVASVSAGAAVVEDHVDEQHGVAPQAEPAAQAKPTEAVQQPAPKARRVVRPRAAKVKAKAKAPKARVVRAKHKAKAKVARARTVPPQVTRTGYPVTTQPPPSWGWDSNK